MKTLWSIIKRIRFQSPIILEPIVTLEEYTEFHPDLKKVKQAVESGKIEE